MSTATTCIRQNIPMPTVACVTSMTRTTATKLKSSLRNYWRQAWPPKSCHICRRLIVPIRAAASACACWMPKLCRSKTRPLKLCRPTAQQAGALQRRMPCRVGTLLSETEPQPEACPNRFSTAAVAPSNWKLPQAKLIWSRLSDSCLQASIYWKCACAERMQTAVRLASTAIPANPWPKPFRFPAASTGSTILWLSNCLKAKPRCCALGHWPRRQPFSTSMTSVWQTRAMSA